MISERLKDLIVNIPKGENHIHIEGSIPGETAIKLAKRNNIALPFSSEEGMKDYIKKNVNSLDSFMASDRLINSVCIKEEDFYEVILELGKRAKEQNIIYTEFLLDYPLNQVRNISLETVVKGYEAGRQEAMRKYGIDITFIAGIDRSLSEEDSYLFVKSLEPYLDIITGIGMDCEERGNPCIKHIKAYQLAQDMGLYLSAHAGEDPNAGEQAVQNIWDAVTRMNCKRIEHGILATKDEELMKLLAEKEILLTICPLSNAMIVYPELAKHPLKFLMDQGIPCSINSDDPPYVGDLVENMIQTADALKLSEEDIFTIERNSLKYSIQGQWHLSVLENWINDWEKNN